MASSTHLIEIDLLRTGQHTVALPLSYLRPQHPYDYLVCLHRATQDDHFEVWLNTLREPHPCIAVPLDAGIPDVPLNLQTIFDRNYDSGAYLRKIDYTQHLFCPMDGLPSGL